MAQWVKRLLHKADNLSSVPGTHGRRRVLAEGCPWHVLYGICMSVYTHGHIHHMVLALKDHKH